MQEFRFVDKNEGDFVRFLMNEVKNDVSTRKAWFVKRRLEDGERRFEMPVMYYAEDKDGDPLYYIEVPSITPDSLATCLEYIEFEGGFTPSYKDMIRMYKELVINK